ncbi:MAG: ABC transporter permease [Bacteroidales bacterium]|nr:ABC transporter permease [Bacteroidales bacterium]
MKLKDIAVKSLSLGIGLAISIILIAKICFEMSYDRCYEKFGNIYQIRTDFSQQGHSHDYEQVSGGVAPGFRQYVPGVECATRTTFLVDSDRFKDEAGNVISGQLILADSSYFDVFPTEILNGDPKKALVTEASLMVSRTFAEKLGGIQEAVGRQIESEEFEGYKMTVAGIFEDFPYQSSQKYDILLSMESLSKRSTENWLGNDSYRAYVRLADGVDYRMLDPAIRLMQEKNQPLEQLEKAGSKIRYYLYPLSSLHTSEDNVRNMLIILSIVSVLLLAISLLNYVLFVISAMVKRSKEVGVRKCYGAGSTNIYAMMMKEAAVDILASLAVSALLILDFQSIIGDLVGVPVKALFVPQTIIAIVAVVAIVFVVAALVPARLYSNIPIASAIRNYKENKRLWKLALLFAQIFVCTFLMSLVVVIGLQYKKAINDKPGYEYENLIFANLRGTDASVRQAIIDKLMAVPGVEDVQMSYGLPLEWSSGNNVFLWETPIREIFNIADQYEGTEGLFAMMGIPFVEGRYPQTLTEVAISESFLEKMAEFQDWSDGAVGKQIYISEHSDEGQAFTVSGVYKDYRIRNLTNPDERASVKFLGKVGEGSMPYILVKVNEVGRNVMDEADAVLDEVFPDREIVFTAYKDAMRDAYKDERRMRNTVLSGCAICILIALFGLVGYVRDESERRSKEVAVRKINGARARDILGLFVGEIGKLGIVAALLADAGAFFAARVWLENFAEKISLSPLIFIAADIIVLSIVAGTIILCCLRITRANPVESLKSE